MAEVRLARSHHAAAPQMRSLKVARCISLQRLTPVSVRLAAPKFAPIHFNRFFYLFSPSLFSI
jgi:hypothetical protein